MASFGFSGVTMKYVVKKHSGNILHVILRPNTPALMIGGLFFSAMGVLAIWGIATRTEFSVEGGELSYNKHRLGMRSDDSFALPQSSITGIEIILKKFGINRSYEVVVKTLEKIYDTSFSMADGDKKIEIAEQSLAALSGGGVYHYEEDGTVPGLILGLTCILGGLYCWFCIQQVFIVADREAGSLMIVRKRSLLSVLAKVDRYEIPLAQVANVRVKAHTLNTGKHQVTSYQVLIGRKDGKPVPVAKGPMFTAESAGALKELLDAWIKGRDQSGTA